MVSFDDNGYLLVLLEVRLHFAAQYFFQLFFFFNHFSNSGLLGGVCCFCYLLFQIHTINVSLSVSIFFRMTAMGFPGQRRGWCGRSFIYL